MNGSPQAAPVVVEAEDLVKVFRDFWGRTKVRALGGISFEIRAGEILGLLGPNGSGKSTTIKLILGLLHPGAGRLTVFGGSPSGVDVKARIGYMPEESYLYRYLTARETLEFYGTLFRLDPKVRRERVDQLLDMIGLAHAQHRIVAEFSKGMARRLALAQALINDPDLILLDEPTSGLDPVGCRQIKDLILTLARRGKSILISSHLLADVEDVCDRIVILFNGRVCAVGPVDALLQERGSVRLTVPSPEPERLRQIVAMLRAESGVEPGIDHPSRTLERFFIDTVGKARETASEMTGADSMRGVAEYLARPPERPEAAGSGPAGGTPP